MQEVAVRVVSRAAFFYKIPVIEKVYYILKKAAVLITTLFLISVLTFTAFRIVPGDPALLILGTEASSEQIEQMHHELGMDKPLVRQYMTWVSAMLRGDWGTSLRYNKPVKELMHGRLSVTLVMGGMALLLIIAAGIPLGVFAASKKDSWLNPLLNALTMLSISIPEFFLSIVVIWIFGLQLHVFAPGRYVSWQADAGGFLRFMIFPVCTIALPQTAILMKYVRATVIAEEDKDYVRTALSKGCRPQRVLSVHVLRNAAVAVLPLIGMMAGNVFTGSIIVEQVYGIPGIGRLLISAVTSRDFPLTQALVLYIAVIIVAVDFLVDVVAQLVDPRIRFGT